MQQGKYLRLSHFKPQGYPEVYPGNPAQVKEMMPFLVENVSRRWTKIPNHDLEALATRKRDVPILGFRQGPKEVCIHIFCNEFMQPFSAMQLVAGLYAKYNLGKPAFAPDQPNWIHTIPLPGADLNPQETILMHQITQSLFWTIFMDYKRNKPA